MNPLLSKEINSRIPIIQELFLKLFESYKLLQFPSIDAVIT